MGGHEYLSSRAGRGLTTLTLSEKIKLNFLEKVMASLERQRALILQKDEDIKKYRILQLQTEGLKEQLESELRERGLGHLVGPKKSN